MQTQFLYGTINPIFNPPPILDKIMIGYIVIIEQKRFPQFREVETQSKDEAIAVCRQFNISHFYEIDTTSRLEPKGIWTVPKDESVDIHFESWADAVAKHDSH